MQVTVENASYTFDPATRTIIVDSGMGQYVNAESLKLIVNATTGDIIYNPLCGQLATISQNQIIVDFDTTSMSSTDTLWVQLTMEESRGTLDSPNVVEDQQLDCLQSILEEQKLTNFLLKSIAK